MKKTFLFCFLIFCAALCYAQQQQKTIIHIVHADKAAYDDRIGKDIQRLIGNVVLRQDSSYFYSDSAYLHEKTKTFEGFSRVHVTINDSIDIVSDRLKYNGETHFLELFDNVVMKNDSMTLMTQYMTYDRDKHLACYPHHGTIIRNDKKMVSVKGYYRDDIKLFYFHDDVVATMPDYQLFTDTLNYDYAAEKMSFEGPTTIINKDNILKGERGYYDMFRDFIHINKNARYNNKEQHLESDTMIYDKANEHAFALNHVIMLDTTHKAVVEGDYAELFQKRGDGYVTKKMRTLYYSEKDTLFLHADTLFMFFDTATREAKRFTYFHNVRFFRNDVQGKCDTMNYTLSDSVVLMRHEPVIWAENSQLSGDSINVFISNSTIDSALLYPNAFIIQKDTIDGFNQIKGRMMTAYFKDSELKHVYNDGNAETIYFLREDNGSMIGINVSQSVAMDIKIENNTISRIKYFKKTNETLYPSKDLDEHGRYLKGFIWLDELRPKDRDDIF